MNLNNNKSFIMKKNILTLVFMLFFSFIFAQQKVALESGGTTTIFGGSNPFLDAYNAAVDGDIIYLPGASMTGFAIDKGVTIIGAGHYPNATLATNPTVINGNITINENADGLHLEGIQFTGSITFGNNAQVDDVTIKRCRVVSINYAGNATPVTPCLNNLIAETIITGDLTMTNLTSSMISNNIIQGKLINGSNNGITNNILMYSGYSSYTNHYVFNNQDNCFISNNIVFRPYVSEVHTGCEMSTFSNNIFAVAPLAGSNTFIDNYFSVPITGLFVNQTGATFDYTHDYQLASSGIYLGTDGNDVGIYGGVFSYKTESIPHNPHIVSKSVATQTNAAGELPVQITVEAQNN